MLSLYFLTLLVTFTTGTHQQWQTVDLRALQYIFGSHSDLDPADFSNAADYDEVASLCEVYAENYNTIDPTLDGPSWKPNDTASLEEKQNSTATGCKDYFLHRVWVQKWANFLFREITHDYNSTDTIDRLTLKPWTSAQLKSLFWYYDAKFHYIFSCTMYKFMEIVANSQDDPADGISFMQTVKSIQDQFYGPFELNDPKNTHLFKMNEQALRGSFSYLWDLTSQDFIESCSYQSENLTVAYDFSPNSWHHALVDLGLMDEASL